MPTKQQTTKSAKKDPKIMNAKILKAEKRSILIAIPIGLLSGLIAYFTASNFTMICALVIGIGTLVMTAMLLFHFHFGKNLPKRVITPEEYGSHLKIRKPPSSGSSGAASYNRANGNPSSSFILPSKYI